MNQVSKLIYNALIKYQALYLPEVGTLRVVRKSASMSSKNEIIPPSYNVEYSLDSQAKSLIDIISCEAGVDASRAAEIYSRWLDKVRDGDVVVIDRVGELRKDSFVVNKELIEALNICREPLRVTRRKSKRLLYTMTIMLLLALAGGGAWWYFNAKPVDAVVEIETEEEVPVEEVAPLVETTSIDIVEQSEPYIVNEVDIVDEVVGEVADEVSVGDIDDVVDSEEVTEDISVTADAEVIVEEVVEEIVVDWRTRDDLRHWVVVGSYSTISNAERAIADILKRLPHMQCDYFKLGSMYAVAAFASDDAEECQEFKRAHLEEFAQSWVYTPKKFR